MTRNRLIIALVLVVVALLVTAAIVTALQTTKPAAVAVARRAPVRVVTVRDRVFIERIGAQGRAGSPAGSSARLSFPESGIVRALYVGAGQTVRAGDAIAELDRAPLTAALAQAEADLRAARAGYGGGNVAAATLANARARSELAQTHLRTLDQSRRAASSDMLAAESLANTARLKVAGDLAGLHRAQTLFAGGVAPAKDVDVARLQVSQDLADERAASARLALARGDGPAALEQARIDVASGRSDVQNAVAQAGTLGAQLAGAQARLESARHNYENGVLRAPAGGVVLQILRRPGEWVDPTSPVVEVGPPASHEATLTLPAASASGVAVGSRVAYRLADGTGALGRVTAVVPAVDANAQTATLVAGGIPPGVISGSALSATIEVAERRGIVVPLTAIVEDPQSGETVVFVEKRGAAIQTFEPRTVHVGASDERSALVTAGLRPGERIAPSGGYELLAPPGS